MGGKQLAVCLLALAGSAGIFLRAHSQLRNTTRSATAKSSSGRSFGVESEFLASIRKTGDRKSNSKTIEYPNRASERAGVGPISLPMTFEPNVGQADPRAAFVGRGKGMTVLLMDDKISVRAGNGGALGIRFQTRGEQTETAAGGVANSPAAAWRGDAKLASESNYFIGNDPRKWRAHVPHFARVESAGAARGVGVAVYGNEDGVEYDLRLAPEADVSKLRLALTGAQSVRLDSSGDSAAGGWRKRNADEAARGLRVRGGSYTLAFEAETAPSSARLGRTENAFHLQTAKAPRLPQEKKTPEGSTSLDTLQSISFAE